MSPLFEPVLVFTVMSVLVGLFTWTYLRNRQREFGFWLLGWSAIFAHFAAPVAAYFLKLPHGLTFWIKGMTLVVAATFFLLSVSQIFRYRRQRAAFIFLVSLAAATYLTGLSLHVQSDWFYVALLSASAVSWLYEAVQFYGWRSHYLLAMVTVLMPGVIWAMWRAGNGHYVDGMNFYLFGLFFATGLSYYRRFRRLTPGVTFTSASFLAWGAVFPVASFLQGHSILLPGFVWDLPKYAVAFGMILTLFENQTALATTAASQYQSLFERNMASVYVSTFEGQLLDCNSSFVKMYGFESKQDALSTAATSLYVEPSERQAFLKELSRRGHLLNYECKQRRKDGSLFWLLERAAIVTDARGRCTIEGTSIDITERKHAELGLRQSEERFATIFRESPIGCAILTLNGVFVDVNDAMLAVLARPAEQVVGKSGVDLALWKSQDERDQFFATLRAQGSVHGMEVGFEDARGKRREGLYSATLVRIADKQCIFGMMLEMTEKRELEAKFLQAQKMEALGRLAGGIAHDFNNLLGVIGGYAELLDAKLSHNENYSRYCGKIVDATQRASGLTRQLLTFSRKEITRPTPLQPDRALRELAAILSRLIGEDVELVLNLQAGGTVLMDKTHFEQIIFNLAINSRDAMPSGGQLFIETEDTFRPIVFSPESVAVSPYVAITIRDTGAGMNEETRRHAFEPFYTTKGVGRGTGLGLATVYGIVQESNGEITIESQPGKGTQISISIPALEDAQAGDKAVAGQKIKKGAGSILLVEDETDLRNVNAEFLASLGYSVICASSGPEALTMAREAGAIDLVISDVVMPKMNGREFADSLLLARPEVKLLFVSGYADDVVLHAGLSREAAPFLQKPFSLKELGAKVSELLADRDHNRAGYESSRANSAG